MDLWSRARQVTIDIARGETRVSTVWEAGVEKPLYLEPGAGLSGGDAVVTRVWDAVTGELLA